MPKHTDLTRLPAQEKKLWHAIIETPKGSHNKYDYKPELGCLVMAKTLPEGMTFPFDFGFIPSTIADDGDPLDVLVLMDFPALAGALIKVRLIGGIRAMQKEKGKKWERNDRLIAIAHHSRDMEDIESIKNLRDGLLKEIADFFKEYNKLDGKRFRALGHCKASEAISLVKKGMRSQKRNR